MAEVRRRRAKKQDNWEIPMDQTTQFMMSALERAGLIGGESLQEIAEKLTAHLTPTVVIIERTEKRLILDITSSEDGSLFCGITTGNKNLGAYCFPGGHQNALTRVGHFDRIVSDHYEQEVLKKIKLVELIRFVSLGSTVRISITWVSEEGSLTTSEVKGWDPETGKAIMVPSTIVTVKPNK